MSRFLAGIAVTLMVIVAVFGWNTLRPRIEVAKDEALTQVDLMLDEQKVRKKEVEIAIDEARQEIERLVAIEISSLVEIEVLAKDLEEMGSQKEKARKELSQIADLLEAGQPITLTSGATMSVAELEDYAQGKMEAFDLLEEKIAIRQETLDIYQRSAQQARERREEGEKAIGKLEEQIELLDAKIAELRAVESQPGPLTEDKVKEAEDLMRRTLAELDIERETIIEMRAFANVAPTVEDKRTQLEQDLQGGEDTDLVSELRYRANE